MTLHLQRRRARGGMRFQPKGPQLLTSLLGTALVVASLIRELRLPPHQRTWHGALFGRIPYDWRLPTPQRVLGTFWQPKSTSILKPTVFGVGLSVNLAALLRPIRHAT
jgi:hypothetical protein